MGVVIGCGWGERTAVRGLSGRSPDTVQRTRTVCTASMYPAAEGSGLEHTYVNNDDVTVLVSGGGRCHWVIMRTVPRICVRFCVKLEHSSVKSIWMIQKATAMGTW